MTSNCKFRVVCQKTGLKSTQEITLQKAIETAEKEGFVNVNGKWFYNKTTEAQNANRSN